LQDWIYPHQWRRLAPFTSQNHCEAQVESWERDAKLALQIAAHLEQYLAIRLRLVANGLHIESGVGNFGLS
jgi:hypothetical protein